MVLKKVLTKEKKPKWVKSIRNVKLKYVVINSQRIADTTKSCMTKKNTYQHSPFLQVLLLGDHSFPTALSKFPNLQEKSSS